MHTARRVLWSLMLVLTFFVFLAETQTVFGCDEPKVPTNGDNSKRPGRKKTIGGQRGASGCCCVANPGRVRVSSEVAEKMVIDRVAPSYPSAAREHGIQGTVGMVVVFGKGGAVMSVRPTLQEPKLAEAAVDAVKRWRFRPYLLNGQPVEVETAVALKFAISEHTTGSVTYNGLPFWSEAKSKASEELISAYDCWWSARDNDIHTPNCKSAKGMVSVRATLSGESPDFLEKLTKLPTAANPSRLSPNEYTFQIFLGNLPLLADMPEVKSVELVLQENPLPTTLKQ